MSDSSQELSRATDSSIHSRNDGQSVLDRLELHSLDDTKDETSGVQAYAETGLDIEAINSFFRDIDNLELGLNLLDLKRFYYWDSMDRVIETSGSFTDYQPVFARWDYTTFLAMFFVAFIGGFGLNVLSRLSGLAVKSVLDIFHKVASD